MKEEALVSVRCRTCGALHQIQEGSIGHRLHCAHCHRIIAGEFRFSPGAPKRPEPEGSGRLHVVGNTDRLSGVRWCLVFLGIAFLFLILLQLPCKRLQTEVDQMKLYKVFKAGEKDLLATLPERRSPERITDESIDQYVREVLGAMDDPVTVEAEDIGETP